MRWAFFNIKHSVRCDIKSFRSVFKCLCGFVVLMYDLFTVFVLSFRLLDIEYEMTKFAFYYVGIGAAVFLLGYFQVGLKMSLFSYKETHLKLDTI